MKAITTYEFDALCQARPDQPEGEGIRAVPPNVYRWLETQSLALAESKVAAWLRLTQRRGRHAVQVTSFAGVIRTPDGHQIEVLPKLGKAIEGGAVEARRLLIEMLRCLPGFRHIRTRRAGLLAARMPLPEIFIAEFLRSVEHVVKRGLRHDYTSLQGNVPALRGKLLIGPHLSQNTVRVDRFFTERHEFSADRPENRLLHTALRRVLVRSAVAPSQRLARELGFAFAEVPLSRSPGLDFQRVRPDRAMSHYRDALAWARLILAGLSPLTGSGPHHAPSLLFPMEALFEAFVARHLPRQVARPLTVKAQSAGRHLVSHNGKDWFRLKPDLLVREGDENRMVIDTKWKLLDRRQSGGSDKYGLSQGDFYQLQAYGLNYLDHGTHLALVYPRTDEFDRPLPVFRFRNPDGLRLWVLPFCLQSRKLLLPEDAGLAEIFCAAGEP